jgi:hypothetical protein
MRLTQSQLETIRTRPQEADENLFIFEPRAIFKCLVNNASIAKGARTIAYDTVTLGSFSAVEAGMTVLIGTSSGGSDVGRIRLKSITPTQMIVSENSDIKWANNLYITVLRYWEVWPIFPRIIQNPNNAEDIIFYKDYDIPHTNQNNSLGTFINAGTHHGVLLEGGVGSVYYTASGSYSLMGSAITYDWKFEGGTPSGSSSATPGWVEYSAPGDYVTTLTVTAANGAVDVTHRYVSVKNKIGEGANTPIVKWSRSDLSGSRSEGGYTVDITAWQDINITDNSLVIIKSDDLYNRNNNPFYTSPVKLNETELAEPYGGWTGSVNPSYYMGTAKYTNAPYQVLEYTFTGIRIDIIATTSPDGGAVYVSLDNADFVLVDLYSPTIQYQQVVHTRAVPRGTYLLGLETGDSGDVNPLSSGTKVEIDAVEYWDSGDDATSSDIFFVGYVEKDSIKYNATTSSVSFTASSITALMKKTTGFSISVESAQSAVKWFQLKDMDVRRAIYHYLRWHSTVLSVADFEFIGDDRKLQYFDADRGSLYDAIDNLLRGALIGSLCSDRKGKLWGEVEPKAYTDPTGTFIPVMEITRRDWMNEPNVEERIYDDLSYVELGGIAYSGAVTGTFTALLSDAPGQTPAHMGSVDSVSGLALLGQTQLNILSGHVWANRNSKYPTVSIQSPIMLKNLDIAPYETVQVHILPEDTVLNVDIQGLYIPTSMSWAPNVSNRITLPNIELTSLVNGNPGDTMIIPPINEIEYPNMNFSFPPFPDFLDIPALAIYDPTIIQNVFVHILDQGIFYTLDFDSEYPTWYSMNVGLPDYDIRLFEVGTTGKVFLQHGADSLWVAPYPGGEWTKFVTTAYDGAYDSPPYSGIWGCVADPNSLFYGLAGPTYARTPVICAFTIDRNAEDSVFIIGTIVEGIGSNNWLVSWKGDSTDQTITTSPIAVNVASNSNKLGSLTKISSGWLYTFYGGYPSALPYSGIIPDSGTPLGTLVALESGSVILHTQSIQSNSVAVNQYKQYITDDGGNTWIPISGTPIRYGQADPNLFQSIITNEDGTQILVGTSDVTIPPGLVYTRNGGASWVTGTFITGTFNATSVWHLQDSGYIIAGYDPNVVASSKIYALYNLDGVTGSTTAIDKTGNLIDYITGTFYPVSIRHSYNYE